MTDPYAVLGLNPSASDDEVRAAYRARSLLLHPDRHAEGPPHLRREAERAMAQLTEAYEAVTRRRSGGRSDSPPGDPASPASTGPLPYRLGRLASRARLARDAAEAGQQGGGFAYRLGWLVGRRRTR